jgi:hypothetical protein
MGVIIDLIYLVREVFKMAFMVLTSPFAIIAGFLMTWQ